MKKSLTFFLIICSYCCKAQVYGQNTPTQFDVFVKNASIEWSAYLYDTIRFKSVNLSALLIKRMEKGEIRTMYPIHRYPYSEDKIRYTNKAENAKMFYPCCVDPIYDSSGNITNPAVLDKPRRRIDSLTYNLLHVSEIFYIENGRLKSYVPWVSPAFSAIIGDDFLFADYYFGTCLNLKYNRVTLPENKLTYLIQTKRKILIDSLESNNMLKKMYGRNMLQTIWPYVLNGKISIYSVGTGNKIELGKLDNFIVSNDSLSREVYDTLGNVEVVKYYNEYSIPYYVPEVEIIQDWYYDYKNNIVICKIPAMLLYVNKRKNGQQENELSPVLKIVFN